MTPANLLAATRAAGLTLALEDGALRTRGPGPALRQWAPAIREGKAELLAWLTPRRLWLVHHADGRWLSHAFTPPASREEVAGWYPLALELEPEDDATNGQD